MKKDKTLTLRVDEDLLKSIDNTHLHLNEHLGCDVTPSYILRMLLNLGIASYSENYTG
tara:strand:- start:268 stop:441 length:174 start_codon:yes stop_codon:yes gene_type:complete